MNNNTIHVFGICGYSGSGKTTLIEAMMPLLCERGLRVAIVKQDAHSLLIDHEGKDSDRLYKAGADVFIRDERQYFSRLHRLQEYNMERLLQGLVRHYDLILVEGYKSTPLPYKIWLLKSGETEPPPEAIGIQHVLEWNGNRLEVVMDLLDIWLEKVCLLQPVYAGILIGGANSRMGRPKQMIRDTGKTWLEKIVEVFVKHVSTTVLLGAGEIPPALLELKRLPDAEGVAGPLSGMRSAMRWAPLACWIFVACDQPNVSPAAIEWILSHRRPGVRAIIPVLPGASNPEPLLAYYDFRIASAMEQVKRPCEIAKMTGVATPTVPENLVSAWRNINTPAELSSELQNKLKGQ